MKRRVAVALVVMFVLGGVIFAQAPPQVPKPGPEHKRLDYFVGKWTSEVEMKQSPFGPAGKFTSTDHNEWMPGGFFLVLHSVGKGAMGEMSELAVMGYDPEEKVYTYHAFNSMGEAEASKGSLEGDTWTWTSESKVEGKPIKTRFTLKEVSPTSYTFKGEIPAGDGGWSTIMEGKSSKMQQ